MWRYANLSSQDVPRRVRPLYEEWLIRPSYDYMIKCSHAFNLLDARNAIISLAELHQVYKEMARSAQAYGQGGWRCIRETLLEIGRRTSSKEVLAREPAQRKSKSLRPADWVTTDYNLHGQQVWTIHDGLLRTTYLEEKRAVGEDCLQRRRAFRAFTGFQEQRRGKKISPKDGYVYIEGKIPGKSSLEILPTYSGRPCCRWSSCRCAGRWHHRFVRPV